MKVLSVPAFAIASVLMTAPWAPDAQAHPDDIVPIGRATGTLTVGTSKISLTRAYAFPEAGGDPGTEHYRVYLTNKPLSAAALKLATTAGADEGDRQTLALELSDAKVYGLEVVIGSDKRVLRVNAYSPEAALGVMILPSTEFAPTTFNEKGVAGRISIASHRDTRLDKAIAYQATFSAAVQRATGRGGDR
jgi:hypothetical protein